MMVTLSLDSPSCEVTLFDPVSVVYRDATRQAKGLYRLKYVGALWSELAYLSRYNSGWFCHSDFNGQTSEAQGVLNVDLTVGSKTVPTSYFIVNSKTTYTVLLGRDWIHANYGIPSTMHQCLI
jgi:hypothetical protein